MTKHSKVRVSIIHKKKQAEEKRPHSVDLGGLDRWLYVVPGHKTRPKECDERCDEFVRAGIGNCLKGIGYTT